MENGFEAVRAERYQRGEPIYCESVGEYTLPDYLPEIRKLLRIETKLLPTGRFVGSGKAEFTGMAIHTLIYSDESGKLASAVLNGDYRFAAPLNSDADAQVFADSRVDRIAHRLTGPRRINIRTGIASDVCMASEEVVDMHQPTDENCTLETLIGHDFVSDMKRLYRDDVNFNESYRFDGVRADEIRPIYSNASVWLKDIRPQAEGVYCNGEIWVKFLYVVGKEMDEIPETVWKKISFDSILPTEYPLDCATVRGYCTSLDAAIEDDGLGNAELKLSGEIVLEGEGFCHRELIYTKDLYAREKAIHVARRPVPAFRTRGTMTQNFTVSGSSAMENTYPGARPVDCSVAPGVMTMEYIDDKIRMTCECKAEGILLIPETGEENAHYEKVEFNFPIRMEIDGKQLGGEGMDYRAHCEFLGGQMRIDGDHLRIDGEMAATLSAMELKNIAAVENIELVEDAQEGEKSGMVIVAYPDDQDTLWSLAKRYRADMKLLVKRNKIPDHFLSESDSPQSIDGMSSLIIS